jgi:hypothetical protein
MATDMTRVGSKPLPERKHGATWVQTERATHEAWSALTNNSPRAASLLHLMLAHMDQQTAVVASRATFASMMGCSEATIKRAVAELRAGNWIEVVQLGGKGGVNAYLVNSRVGWADSRDRLGTAAFTARVIARRQEQELPVLDAPLRRIPTLYPGELQLPIGAGEAPPSQPSIEGLEPDIPALLPVETAAPPGKRFKALEI